MRAFVLFGTNDLEGAKQFYDAVFGALGGKRLYDMATDISGAMYGDSDGPAFGIVEPYDGKAATVGNGAMVALPARSCEEVRRIYELALTIGGVSEGEPGPRGNGGGYCAYLRDLDGNKLCVFHEPPRFAVQSTGLTPDTDDKIEPLEPLPGQPFSTVATMNENLAIYRDTSNAFAAWAVLLEVIQQGRPIPGGLSSFFRTVCEKLLALRHNSEDASALIPNIIYGLKKNQDGGRNPARKYADILKQRKLLKMLYEEMAQSAFGESSCKSNEDVYAKVANQTGTEPQYLKRLFEEAERDTGSTAISAVRHTARKAKLEAKREFRKTDANYTVVAIEVRPKGAADDKMADASSGSTSPNDPDAKGGAAKL